MRAIGYRKPSPALDALEAFEIPRPTPESRDLLVEVRAVAVNPVDYKVASGTVPEAGGIKVVGYDGAGVVVEAGREMRLFKPGDEVFCAGSIGRARWAKDMGAHHVVDHKKPLAPQVGALGLGAPAFVFARVPSGGLFADLQRLRPKPCMP